MDLSALASAVAVAAADSERPPEPGETKLFMWPIQLLDPNGEALLWQAVHSVVEYDGKLGS